MIATLDHYSTLAKSYNTLDFSGVSEIMAHDIVFHCQYFEESKPVVGKAEVMKTIRQIFTQLRKAKPKAYPKLAIMGDQSKSRCQLCNLTIGDRCILLVNDPNDIKGVVCLAQLNTNNKLSSIDVCRLLQRLTALVSTIYVP